MKKLNVWFGFDFFIILLISNLAPVPSKQAAPCSAHAPRHPHPDQIKQTISISSPAGEFKKYQSSFFNLANQPPLPSSHTPHPTYWFKQKGIPVGYIRKAHRQRQK